MVPLSIFTWIGWIWLSAVGQGAAQKIPYGIPVQSGLYIPVNNTHIADNTRNINQSTYGFKIPNRSVPPQYPTNNYAGYPKEPGYGSYPVPSSYGRSSFGNVNSRQVDNTLTMGQREPGDEMVLHTIITKKVKWFRSAVLEKEFEFPDSSSRLRLQRITSIVVEDNTKNGSGGSTIIRKGGINSNKVKITFQSKPNSPIDLLLTIYGIKAV